MRMWLSFLGCGQLSVRSCEPCYQQQLLVSETVRCSVDSSTSGRTRRRADGRGCVCAGHTKVVIDDVPDGEWQLYIKGDQFQKVAGAVRNQSGVTLFSTQVKIQHVAPAVAAYELGQERALLNASFHEMSKTPLSVRGAPQAAPPATCSSVCRTWIGKPRRSPVCYHGVMRSTPPSGFLPMYGGGRAGPQKPIPASRRDPQTGSGPHLVPWRGLDSPDGAAGHSW